MRLNALRSNCRRSYQFINDLPRRLYSSSREDGDHGRDYGDHGRDIIELRPAVAALDDQIFNAVCEMEGELRAIDEFADALALVSETMDESPHGNAINRLAWEIKQRTLSAERRRSDLSRLTHPNRPGQKP
jgi:hypothetical protein